MGTEVADAGWEGYRYAAAAAHHRAWDDWFLEQQPPRPTDVVVDAGCGSGEFSARLAALVPEGRVIGVEPDPSMLEAARGHRAPNLEFRQGQLQDLEEICGAASADLVASRAALHWIPMREYPRCFDAVRRVLRPGGWFHAESGAAGNVAALKGLLDELAERFGVGPAAVAFPDPGLVLELLEQAGFRVPPLGVTSVAQRRSFDRHQLVEFLRTQAAVAYVPAAQEALLERFHEQTVARIEELRRHDGSYDQTFVRLHVRVQRPR